MESHLINKLSLMTPGELEERLNTIADIIEEIDNRCMVANRPASPIQNEMRQEEITLIYKLAKGGHGNVKIGERLTVLS